MANTAILWQKFMTCFVTRATAINNIVDRQCHIKKLKSKASLYVASQNYLPEFLFILSQLLNSKLGCWSKSGLLNIRIKP